MLLALYRFVSGWLYVEFYGTNVSRFLNLCTRHGIVFWNVDTSDCNKITALMYLRNIYDLRPMLRKTHVHFSIRFKRGLPFLLHRYRKRKMFAGIIVCVILAIAFLSTKIWRIEFVGNSSLSEETLLNYLAKQDITYGSDRSDIDNDALELALRQDFDAIIWASVYEQGTKLVVSVQEKIASDRAVAKDADTPMDLIAVRDARVDSIITRKGIGMVKAGDSVKKGDLLVSGRQEILDDNGEVKAYYYEIADADVIGMVSYDYEDWIEEEVIQVRRTGKEHTRYFARVGEYQFTSPVIHADYDYETTVETNHQLCMMNSFYLPVYFGTITDYEEQKIVKKMDLEEAKSVAIGHFEHFITNLEQNGVSIIDKNVMIEKIDLKYHIYGKVTASESIIRQRPTEILPDPVVSTEEQQAEE